MKIFNTSKRKALFGFIGLVTVATLVSCNDSSEGVKYSSAPPQLERVSLVNKDSTTTSGTRGHLYLIIGKHLQGTRSVTFNGAKVDLNPAFITSHNIIARVPGNTPYANASDSIVVTTNVGSAGLPFHIIAPPPTVLSFSPSAGPAGQIVTIKGHVFNGADTVRIGDKIVPIISSDTNQVKVKVPEKNLFGKISVTTPGGTNSTKYPFGLKFKIYTDAYDGKFYNGTYGGTATLNNTEHVSAGAHSIKMHYTGAFAAFIAGYYGSTPIDLTKYSTVKISIYGGQNLGSVSIFFDTKSDNKYHVKLDVVKGEYTTFYVPFSKLGNPKTFTQFFVQDGSVTNFTIYIDNLGFY